METIEERYPPKYKVGDTLHLKRDYRTKKDKPYKGVVIRHFTDANQLEIGASFNVYETDTGLIMGEAAWYKPI